MLALALVLAAAALSGAHATCLNQTETSPISQRDQRLMFEPLAGDDSSFKFRFADVPAGTAARVDNAAALQLQQDKISNKFLATLPVDGAAQFLTVIKPCGILLPHVHARATELFSIIFGQMSAGIAQENGVLQNITFKVDPGEVFIVPQGLLHYNHNQQCTPLAFFQTFNGADPIALTVTNALASLNANPDGAASIAASGAQNLMVSEFAAFQLDQACLAHCGFPPEGAPNGGLDDLPYNIKVLFGL